MAVPTYKTVRGFDLWLQGERRPAEAVRGGTESVSSNSISYFYSVFITASVNVLAISEECSQCLLARLMTKLLVVIVSHKAIILRRAVSRTCLAPDELRKAAGPVCLLNLTASWTTNDIQQGVLPYKTNKKPSLPHKSSFFSRWCPGIGQRNVEGGPGQEGEVKSEGFILNRPLSSCHSWVYEEARVDI